MGLKNQQNELKTVGITGARGVLGQEAVKRFLEAGCEVVAFHHRSFVEALDDGLLAPELRTQLSWMQADLADSSSVQAAFQKLDQNGTTLDALVHCAGGFRFSFFDEISLDDLSFLIDANLKSTLFTLREVLPRMKKTGFGRIVLVGAKVTERPGAGMGAYAASKAAINMMVSSLAEEVKALNININAVLPSILDTRQNRKDMPNADFKTWVKNEDLAEILFALTQPWTNSIHGALLPVAGRL
jgi:NAD(P)-dependent dehydrogenase (short-subunit alcohol dehydrogenase family)